MGGTEWLDALNGQLPSIAASKGQSEDPVAYAPRVSMTFDGADFRDRVVLVENFAQLPQRTGAAALPNPNLNFLLSGTNVATSAQAFADNGVLLTTAGASGDQVIVDPKTNSLWGGVQLASSLRPLARFRAQTTGNGTSVRYEFGVRPTTTAMDDTTDSNKMLIRFDSAGTVSTTNWVFVTSKAGVNSIEDTRIAYVSNQRYIFTIAMDAALNALLFVSDATRTHVDELACDPSIHSMASGVQIGFPYAGVQARTAAARAFKIEGFARAQGF